MSRCIFRVAASTLASGALITAMALAAAAPASAHAIVELKGVAAYAGRTSGMTLEMQHGCLSNEIGIQKVVATFNKKFGKVVPKPVTGWRSKVRPAGGGGTHIVWLLTGETPAFNQPTYFPMSITWPDKPGIYGVPVVQVCDGEVNRWNVPDGPATAFTPSPPLYPLPQIKVLPAP